MPVAVFNAFDAEKQVEVQASLMYLTRLTPRSQRSQHVNIGIRAFCKEVRKYLLLFSYSLTNFIRILVGIAQHLWITWLSKYAVGSVIAG